MTIIVNVRHLSGAVRTDTPHTLVIRALLDENHKVDNIIDDGRPWKAQKEIIHDASLHRRDQRCPSPRTMLSVLDC